MSRLSLEIEAYLLDQADWVATSEICRRFDLRDCRVLRQVGDQPGLCTAYAISGDQGLKHVNLATTREWLRFKHRLMRHGISEIIRVRKLEKKRRSMVKVKKHFLEERDSGQLILRMS